MLTLREKLSVVFQGNVTEGQEAWLGVRSAITEFVLVSAKSGLNSTRIAELLKEALTPPNTKRISTMRRLAGVGFIGRLRFFRPLRRRAKGGHRAAA